MEHMLDSIYKVIVGISSSIQWWGFYTVCSLSILDYIVYKNPELKKSRQKIGVLTIGACIGLFICLILAAQFPWDTISMIEDILVTLYLFIYSFMFIHIIFKWIKLRRQKKIS